MLWVEGTARQRLGAAAGHGEWVVDKAAWLLSGRSSVGHGAWLAVRALVCPVRGLLDRGLGGPSCLRAVHRAECGSRACQCKCREATGGSRTLVVVVRPLREGFRRITGLAAGVCGGAGVQAGGKRDEGSSGHFFFSRCFSQSFLILLAN